MKQERGDTCAPAPLALGDLTVPFPVIQGGMGIGISLANLAAAVANEGGVGVISAVGIGMMEPDFEEHQMESHLHALRKTIRRAREMTDGVLGVNIMVALTDYMEYAMVAAEEGIDVILSGAGLPLKLPECLAGKHKPKLIPIVSSHRAADILCKKWWKNYKVLPAAVVVEGPLAGGHLGFKREELESPAQALESLVPQTVQTMRGYRESHDAEIPVIAAGGIYTGGDIRRFLELGAAGVQMGTRFVTTVECDADDAFKQAYLDATEEDLVIIESPVGLPGRAVRNAFLDAMRRGERRPVKCPFRCIITCPGTRSAYCIALALFNARRGDFENGFAFAGANAWRTDRILTVHELMETLRAEYAASVTESERC